MENENMGYYDERALFVDGLGQLLKTAYLGVTALRYIYPEQSSNGMESVEIQFGGAGKRTVCIELDSRAAIIKDVLRGCEYLNNKRQDARGDAWVIISSASPEYFARRFFGARIEVTRLLPPLDVCLKRLELDDTRPDKSFWRQALREWFDEYAEKHGPMYWADADAAESGAQNA